MMFGQSSLCSFMLAFIWHFIIWEFTIIERNVELLFDTMIIVLLLSLNSNKDLIWYYNVCYFRLLRGFLKHNDRGACLGLHLRLRVVPLLVFFQVAGVRKPLGTEWALVWSLSSVYVLVDLQVPELGEFFATDATTVRSLSRVSPEVGL